MGVVKYFQGFCEEAIHYLSLQLNIKQFDYCLGERYHMEKNDNYVQRQIIGNH